MVTLRPIAENEFEAYSALFLADYSAEIESNYGYSAERSMMQAKQELADDLPQGLETPDQFLLTIENTDQDIIGYLWYTLYDNGETAFILDFILLKQFRGMGLGKASLSALEQRFEQSEVKQIKLRVAGDNHRAFKLYKRMGFSVTGINMIKHMNETAAHDDLEFRYMVAKSGAVLISRNKKQVTTLRGKSAAKFLKKIAKLNFAEEQQLMARATGNYKRGNERQAKNQYHT